MFHVKNRLRKWFQSSTECTDWVGYEVLIEFIKKNKILNVRGDLLEIGAFLGGGTRKLSSFLSKASPGKQLWVIDVFDPTFDWTTNTHGDSMSHLYANALARFNGKSQWEIFQANTRNCKNVKVIKSDSRLADVGNANLCFAFIDGNHDPDYVQSDFRLAWTHLNSGGVIAFDDYGKDLPQTTKAIDGLVSKHHLEISDFSVDAQRHLAYIIRK